MKLVKCVLGLPFALSLTSCNSEQAKDLSSFSIKKTLTPIDENGGVWVDGIKEPVASTAGTHKGSSDSVKDDGKSYNLPTYKPKYINHKDCLWTTVNYTHDGDTFNVDWIVDKWDDVWTGSKNSSGTDIDTIAIRTIGVDTDEISNTGGTPTLKGHDQKKYIKKLLLPGDAVCLIKDSSSGDRSYNRFLRWVLIDKPVQIGSLLGLTVDPNTTENSWETIQKEYFDGDFSKAYYPDYKDYYTFNFATIMAANTDARLDCGRFAPAEQTEVRNDVKGCPENAYY